MISETGVNSVTFTTVDDFSPILNYVRRYIDLTEEEELIFTSLLSTAKIQRRQFIVQPDFVCRFRTFIVKGALRAYFLDASGKQHTVYLAIEDWWITDFNSYINQVPASLFVEAVEDCLVNRIEFNAEQILLEKVPKFERLFRILSERAFNAAQQRMLSNLSMSAEERYINYVAKYPSMISRFPQYIIASYLGFSTEFLSKIRHRMTYSSPKT